MTPVEMLNKLMNLGKSCAVGITGDPDDVNLINTPEEAFAAIEESIRLGYKSHNELNELKFPSK